VTGQRKFIHTLLGIACVDLAGPHPPRLPSRRYLQQIPFGAVGFRFLSV
jgi:hypothetical protein